MGEQYLKNCLDEMSSNNVNNIKTLFQNNGSNFGVQNKSEFYEIISKAYCAMKLNHVRLSTETELIVRNELMNLRFFQENANQSRKCEITKEHIEQRIDLVIRVTGELVNRFSSVDDKFLHSSKFVAKNIRVLKRFLKSTYDRLPWEEMEYCLACFLGGNVRSAKNSWTLPVDKLLQHLGIFSNSLANENNYISTTGIEQLIQVIRSTTPAEVSANIIRRTPHFKDLYHDYEQIRDLHSLELINDYINLALTANTRQSDGQFVILRAFQVIGEHMKDTPDSPMVSCSTKERLIALLPKKAREIIIDLRDSFSHSKLLHKRLNIEWTDSNVANMQNDFKKIHSSITNILWRKKVRHIWSCLEKISNLNSVLDVQYAIQTMNISNLTEGSFSNSTMSIFEKLEELIHQSEIKIKKQTQMEKTFFKNIKQIINSEHIVLRNFEKDFLSPVYVIDYAVRSTYVNKLSKNRITHIKLMAEKALSLIVPQMECINLERIVEITTDILTNVSSRIPYYDQYEIKRIGWKICCAAEVEFEATLVKWIERWRDEVCGYKYRRHSNSTCILANQRQQNMRSRLADLQRFLNNKSLKKDLAKDFEAFKCDELSKAALEMIVLDILSFLGESRKLMDNPQLLDLDSATLIGQSLRNYLSHGDALVNGLQIDDCMDLLLNARKLAAEIVPPENRRIGQIVQSDPLHLEADYVKDLKNISNQEDFFKALSNGNLDAIKNELKKGADIKARNLHLKTAMHFASEQQNLDIVKLVIDENVTIDAKDVDGQNVLHVSAAFGRFNIVKFLICVKNLEIDEKDDKNGQTPLHLAAINGHEDVVNFLLNQNASYGIKDKNGYSPVHYAVFYDHKNIAIALLDMECNVDANRAYGGLTPLHIAAENGHLDLVLYLLNRKANVNAESDRQYTPLHMGVKGDSLEVVKVLISQNAKVNSRTISGATPLHLAAIYSQKSILSLLVEEGSCVNDVVRFSSPLILAAEHGNLGAVEVLLENQADITLRNVSNMTPLHYAAAYGHHDVARLLISKETIDLQAFDGCTALHLSCLYGYLSIVKLLVEEGADVHITDINGCTALHLAAEKGHSDIVKYLIDINTNLIVKTDLNNLTALHFCCLNQHKEVVRILIENGANVNAPCLLGVTPLYIALGTCSNEIVELFMATHESTDSKSYRGFTALHLAVVKGNPSVVEYVINRTNCDMNARSDSGYTALHLAVLENHESLINLLIDRGSNINARDSSTRTPLYYAIKRNYRRIVSTLIQRVNGVTYDEIGDSLGIAIRSGYDDVVETLLRNIAFDINIPIDNDETCLYLAVKWGHTRIVEMLLSQRVFNENPRFQNVSDVNACSRKGFSPLHLAVLKGQFRIVKTLLRNGADLSLLTYNNKRMAIELAIWNGNLNVVKKIIEYDSANIFDYDTLLRVAAEAGKLNIAKYLVFDKEASFDTLPPLRRKKCSVVKLDLSNYKPVFVAALRGHKDLVEFFLNLKPSILYELSNTGLTLLHYAAINGNCQLAKCLIDRNIDINVTGRIGVTPLHVATMANKTNMIKFLLNHGAFLDAPFDQSTAQTTVLTELPALSEYRTTCQLLTMANVLLYAIKDHSFHTVVYAIDSGAVVNTKWMNGITPLHYASWKGIGEVVDILLRNGADPNITSKSGKWAPLHYASKFGHFDIVKKLLSNGALYNIRSISGRSPRDFAEEIDIVNLFNVIEVCFENVYTNSSTDFWNNLDLNNIDTIKCIMNALNDNGQNLITVCTLTEFGNIEELKHIFQSDLIYDYELANKYYENEQYEAALEIYQKILLRRTEIFGPDNLSTIDIKEIIACILSHQLNLSEALQMMKAIFQVRRAILGIDHDHTLRIRSAIAIILYKQHKDLEALQTLEIVLEKRMPNRSEREKVLQIQTHIAVVLSKMQNYERALKICNDVFREYETTLDPEHPKTLIVQGHMGNIMSKQGDLNKAVKILQNVYESQKRVLGPYHPETLRTLRGIGDAYFYQSNYTEAMKVQREVLALQIKNLENNHPDILITRNAIADIFYSQGEIVKALGIYKKDLEKRASLLGHRHPEIMATSKRIQQIRVAINLDDHSGRVPFQKRYPNRGCVNLLEFGINLTFPDDVLTDFDGPLSNLASSLEPPDLSCSPSSQEGNPVSFTEMDPIRILLKFIRNFSQKEYYPQADLSVFDFLRLVNEALMEKLTN